MEDSDFVDEPEDESLELELLLESDGLEDVEFDFEPPLELPRESLM